MQRADRRSLIAGTFFALAIAVGVYLVWLRGPAIIGLGLLGLIGGWGYTAPAARVQEPRARASRSCSC